MKNSIFTILSMALLASCSSELIETTGNTTNKGDVEKVSIVSHPFVFDDDTRTSLTATDKGISFAWANYDALGVFPIAPTTNNQARQALSVPADCETDAHNASFDGAGWELKKGNTYAAYCPYNGSLPAETPYTEVPIDMTGQDGTLETIGKKYDYMYAPSSFAEENVNGHTHEVVFDFQHAIAILQLKLTMPVAATWKSLTLTNMGPTKCWTTSATMNVQNGAITSKIESRDITLALNNVSTTANNKEVTLYVAVLPIQIGTLSLTATTSNNESYCASVTGKRIEAGKAYRFTASLDPLFTASGYENDYAYVDLGLPSGLKWATMNVGATRVTSYGMHYAWGETQPDYDKKYNWSSYEWCYDSDYFYKYEIYGPWYKEIDNKNTLDPEDDAATQNWGGAWRMPTHAEQEELVNNCYCVWTSKYNGFGIAGYIVYAAKLPSDKGQVVNNGNTPSSEYSLSDSHIFLPAAGYWYDSTYEGAGNYSNYWSSSLSNGWTGNSLSMSFTSDDFHIEDYSMRCMGLSVRAVCK